MSGFSMDSFRGKSIVEMQKIKEKGEEKPFSRDRLDRHKLDVGKNIFRIYPARTPEENWSYKMRVAWLPFKKNDNTWNDTNRPVFDARAHSTLTMDIVNSYRYEAKNLLIEKLGKEDGEKEFAKLGYRKGQGIDNSCNCNSKEAHVVYADKLNLATGEWVFGMWEIGYYIQLGMDRIVFDKSDDGSPVFSVEPFTDVYEGVPVVVEYTPDAKTNDAKTSVSLRREPKKVNIEGTVTEVMVNKPQPLTEEKMKYWFDQPSLRELYENTFSRKDMETQIEAIAHIDEKLEIGLFHEEGFQNKVETYKSLVEGFLEEQEKYRELESKGEPTDKLPFDEDN